MRIRAVSVTDDEVLNAFQTLCRSEGILPALESSHAIAHLIKIAPKLERDQVIVVNLSGRGDKDLFNFARAFKDESFRDFLKDEYNRYAR